MCGIIGAYAPNSNWEVDRAVNALDHRGPDERGIHLSSDGKVLIAHTRLSLVGISDGQQPFVNRDVIASVNGELYDYSQLRSILEGQGHVFKTNSDSELVIHLYRQYNIKFVDYLRGEFALVLWDEKRQSMIAVRDRFGIKPLYYSLSDKGICFASEAKAIFAMGAVCPEWDEASFCAVASRQYLSPEKSLFKGIKQVRPGSFVVFENSRLTKGQYWDLDYPDKELPDTDDNEVIAGFRVLLVDSVKQRMKADLPVCYHLSGGLDSTSLVGIANQVQSGNTCFSVSFDGDNYDEFQQAQSSAEFFGVDLQVVDVSTDDIFDHLSDAVFYSEGLGINGHFTAKYLLNKQIKKSGFSIAISGEGADELLLGYPHFREDLFSADTFFIKGLFESNEASRGIMLAQGKQLDLSSVGQCLGFIPSFLKAKASMGFKVTSLFTDDFADAQSERDCYQELLRELNLKDQFSGRSNIDKSVYLWIKTALSQYILRTLGDGCEMANSIEGRVPFLDHKLFEFCRRVKLDLKIRDKVEKYLLREAVKEWIPRDVYLRQKHPFMAPPQGNFFKAQVEVRDLVDSSSFRKLGFFDKTKVIKVLDSLSQMGPIERKSWDPVLFTILTSIHMQERILEGCL